MNNMNNTPYSFLRSRDDHLIYNNERPIDFSTPKCYVSIYPGEHLSTAMKINPIPTNDLIQLADDIKNNTTMRIRCIYFYNLNFDENNFNILIDAFNNQTIIRDIIFTSCIISPNCIANLISTVNTILNIRLEYCSFKPPGLLVIANSLKKTKTLRQLWIKEYSYLARKGYDHIASAMQYNYSITHLSLHDYTLPSFLASYIERNKRIMDLNIDPYTLVGCCLLTILSDTSSFDIEYLCDEFKSILSPPNIVLDDGLKKKKYYPNRRWGRWVGDG